MPTTLLTKVKVIIMGRPIPENKSSEGFVMRVRKSIMQISTHVNVILIITDILLRTFIKNLR
jgi:hypothetical protein